MGVAMLGMPVMRRSRVGMRGIRVGMGEISVGMQEIGVVMLGIRVGMQIIGVRMGGIRVGMRGIRVILFKNLLVYWFGCNPGARGEHFTLQLLWEAARLLVTRILPCLLNR